MDLQWTPAPTAPPIKSLSNNIFICPHGAFSFIIIPYKAALAVPKKVELLIRFFEPFWISRVFHFFLRTFGEVAAHPGPLGASDETFSPGKIDISGSNETL